MFYTLMHKDVEVLSFAVKEPYTWAQIHEIYNEAHLPYNIQRPVNSKEHELNYFLGSRVIPNSRENIHAILSSYQVGNAFELSMSSYMASISDHYWVKPEGMDISWKDINFYENAFDEDKIFIKHTSSFGKFKDQKRRPHLNPNTSNNGTMAQMWLRQKQGLYLYKLGRKTFFQETLNEAVASDLLDLLQIPHVSYHIESFERQDVSVCQAFTNDDLEFVPAWQIFNHPKPNRAMTELDYYIQLLGQLGLDEQEARLANEQMILFDYVIANEDRHWGNFGIVRNSSTLQPVGLAPIFDNGNSLRYQDAYVTSPRSSNHYVSRSFRTRHDNNLKQLRLLDGSLFDALENSISDIFERQYDKLQNPQFPLERATQLAQFVEKRIDLLHAKLNK